MSKRLLKIRASTLFVVSLTFLTGNCKSEESKDDVASTSDEDSDDDHTVVEPVSLGLLASDFLDRTTNALSPALASQSYDSYASQPAANQRSGQVSITDDNTPIVTGILNAPSLAGGELLRLLVSIKEILSALVGPDGYFGPNVITISGAAKPFSQSYKLSGSAASIAQYAELIVQADDSPYRYALDLYAEAAPGTLERKLRLEFSPDQTDPAYADVHLTYGFVNSGDSTRQHLEATYNTRTNSLTTAFGRTPAAESAPLKTIVKLDMEPATSATTIQGAYVWKRAAASSSGLLPRYYKLVDGDIEVFKAKTFAAAGSPLTQEIAFVPVESKDEVSSPFAATEFATYQYPNFAKDFLTEVLRRPDVNADCASSGTTIRQAFGSDPAPDSVADAPADLCQSNAAVSNTQVASIINDTCYAGVDIALPVKLAASGTTTTLSLCSKLFEAMLLANPQFFVMSDETRSLVPESQTGPDHKAALEDLRGIDFIDITPLRAATWEELPSKTPADFTTALDKP